jgi:hypothetical protein
MPFLLGYAAWIAATLFAYQAAVYAIISRRAACIAAIAPGPVLVNIVNGHTGFLTAALVGLSLVFIERRPWVSGIFLGLLTYKPHFGVLFPLALLASRNWRALGSAAAVSAALAILAAIAFGYQGWQFFFEFLANRNAGLSTNQGFEILYLQSVFALLHWMGIDLWITWTAHLAVAGAVALAVWFVWAKPFPFALRATVLCIGSVMVTPYVLAYDLCILSIAAAFLVSDGLSRGFLPGERTGMLICWAILFPVWTSLAPIGPFLYFSLLLLAARRIAAYLKGALPQELRPFRSSEAGPALGTATVR